MAHRPSADPRITNCPLDRVRSSWTVAGRRRRAGAADRVRDVTLIGMMAAVLTVSSWVSVPFYPVPLTLQTLAVLVAGGLLGPVRGAASVAVYLLLGLVGVPVFAGFAAGAGVLFGPLGGYLLGFVLAAAIMGAAGRGAGTTMTAGAAAGPYDGPSERLSVAVLAAGAILASAAVYVVGVPWLMVVTGMAVGEALTTGLAPFVPGDALKAVAAVVLVRSVGASLRAQAHG